MSSRRGWAGRLALLGSLLAALAAGGGLLFGQARVMTLSSARLFGRVSRPAVQFPHGLHVSAGVSCASCHHHVAAGEPMQQCASCHAGAREIRNAFHRSCVGCHDARQARGLASGPRTCAQCHPWSAPGNEEGRDLPDSETGSSSGK
jgi:hypothetical protein